MVHLSPAKMTSKVFKFVLVLVACIFHREKNTAQGEFKCPKDWVVQGPNCFFVNNTRVTWHQAVQQCININATLAKVTNEDQAKFLGQRLRGDGWIGVHDDIGDESFTYLDEGLPLNFTYWAPGEPNNAAENCVSMYGYSTNKGRWNDNFCRTPRQFICEKRQDSTRCPDKWRVFAGTCYYFSNDTQTWFDARKQCRNSTSSDLVVIETEIENNFLKGAIIRGNYWIGLNDRKKEGEFKWNDNNTVPSFYLWNFGEPNNFNNLPMDCATMLPQSYRKGRWTVASCKSFYGYVCEKQREQDEECGDGWITRGTSEPNDTSCYQYNRNMSDWYSARKHCQQIGGDLIVITSSSEQTFIKTRLLTQSWIGLNDLKKTGQWSWLDEDDPITYSAPASKPPGTTTQKYTNWYRNEPSSRFLKNLDCALVHTGAHNRGKWANTNCNLRAGYICETTTESCTGNWKLFNGHCYSFNIDPTTWSEAPQRCKLQVANSELVVIENQAEQNFINENLKGVTHLAGLWTGLNSKVKRGTFRWLNSTSELQYTNWAPRSPSVYLQEACVSVHSSGYNRQGRWNDLDCMELRGYVCQTSAEGDTSYFDFSYNSSVYKIVRQRFSKEEGEKFCAKVMGINATLLHLENEDEYNEVNSELILRFSSYSSQFWVDGDAQGNDSYTVFGDGYRRPVPSRGGSQPADLGRRCLMMSPRSTRSYVSYPHSRTYVYAYKMYPRSCCEEKMIVCEKTLDGETSMGYDFQYNDSLYKVITVKNTNCKAAEAICRTLGVFYGSGHLVEIDSQEELIALSAELKVRHLGNQFEYWVGGDPTGNLTYDNLLREPNEDEKCLILTHEGYPDIPWTKRTLDLVPAKCDTSRKLICELNLYLGGPIFAPQDQNAPPPPDSDNEPTKFVYKTGCVGPCIGLAVAFPFGIILAVAMTAGFFIYYKRRDQFGFSFHKESDEVYLTA